MVHDADLTTSYLTRLALAKVSREELCYVFYHLCNGTDAQLIKATCESLTGKRLSDKWVHKQAVRLAKIETTDLLEMFQPILKASPEMLSELSEDWEGYKQSEILNKKAIRDDS